MRETKYVEDSTRGSANIEPMRYKGDVYTQTWIDSRKLATLSIWLDENEYNTRYLSEVVKFTLDLMLDMVIEAGNVKMIEYTEEARDILNAKYRVNLNPGKRGKRNIQHNMTLDSRRKRGKAVDVDRQNSYNPESRFFSKDYEKRKAENEQMPVQEQKQEQPTPVVSKAEIEQGVKIYEELRKKELKEAAKAEIEQVLANADIDEDGVIRPREDENGKGGNVGEEEYGEYLEREKKREEMEGLDREKKRLEKRREKLLNILDEEREKEKKEIKYNE